MTTYYEAITSATRLAKTLGTSAVVRYWKATNDFSAVLLSTATSVGGWDYCVLVSSVDQNGKVTEGDWLKEMIPATHQSAA